MNIISKMLGMLTLASCSSVATSYGNPVTCSDGVSGNGSIYFGGGYSCVIGDLLFSDLTYKALGNAPVNGNAITVDTLGPAGSGASILNPEIGLSLNGLGNDGVAMGSTAVIGFTITVLGGGTDFIADHVLLGINPEAGSRCAAPIVFAFGSNSRRLTGAEVHCEREPKSIAVRQ